MNIHHALICALLLCSVRAFEIQDRFTLPPNEEINQLIVNNDHAYALIRSSNPGIFHAHFTAQSEIDIYINLFQQRFLISTWAQ